MANLSEKIKEARQNKNLTVEALAKELLLPMSVIRDIETGKFDKFKGDEQYVKMYLKKICSYLDIDNNDIQSEYLEITQAYQLKELEEQKAREEKYKNTGNTTVIQKIDLAIKNLEYKPLIRKEKRVYEDRYLIRYFKYALLVALIVATVFVIWYAIVLTSRDNTSFQSNKKTVEGDVTSKKTDTSESEKKTDAGELIKKDDKPTKTTISKQAKMNYKFKLTDPNAQTFTVKIEFATKTWASLKVNGRNYNQFAQKTYNETIASGQIASKPETVTLTFNKSDFVNLDLRIGYNQGHKFYINDELISIDPADYNSNLDHLILVLEK